MSSRIAYTAQTPDISDVNFALPRVPSTGLSNLDYNKTPSYFAESLGHNINIGERSNQGRISAATVWTAHNLSDIFQDFSHRNAGLLLVIASQAFGSITNVSVKKIDSIDPPISTLELVAVRMFIPYVCCVAYMLSVGIPDPFLGPKGVRILLITRSFVGFLGLFGLYYPLQYLSVSDGTVLTFLTPLCTAIAGALLLGENFTRREAFAGLVSLAGVVLIARPASLFGSDSHIRQPGGMGEAVMASSEKGTPRDRLIAVGVALVGVMGFTGAYISIRAIGTRAHPMHTMSIFFAFCVIISTIAMFISKTPWIISTRLDWLALLIVISVTGFVAQALLIMGLQRETAGRSSMAIYTQIVFAAILERIVFHTVPTTLSVIGAILILASALFLSAMNLKENETPNLINLARLGAEPEVEEGLLNAFAEHGDENTQDAVHLVRS